MTYGELVYYLVLALGAIVVWVAAVGITRLVQGLMSGSSAVAEDEDKLPASPGATLRAAIGWVAQTRSGRSGIETWLHRLNTGGPLKLYGIARHYCRFAMSDDPDALRSLVSLLNDADDQIPDPVRVLYGRLHALQEDLLLGDGKFSHLEAWAAERPAELVEPSDWIDLGIAALLAKTEQLADLAREVNSRGSGGDPTAESGALERRLLLFSSRRASVPVSGAFEAEEKLLRQGINELIKASPASDGQEATPKDSAPPEEGARNPLTLRPATLTLPYNPDQPLEPLYVRLFFRFHNAGRKGLDGIFVRWRLAGSGAEADHFEGSFRVGYLGPGKSSNPVPTPAHLVPRPEADGRPLTFHLSFPGKGGSHLSAREEVPVRWVETRTLRCPYALRPNQPASFFVGRHAELEKLRGWLVSDESHLIVLWGLPSIGKTAVLYEASRLCEERVSGWERLRAVAISLDHSTYFSAGDWHTQIAQALQQKITQVLSLHQRETRTRGDRSPLIALSDFFNRVNVELEKDDLRLFVMLDEYQRIEDLTDSNLQKIRKDDFVRFLKGLAESYPRILFVLAGLHDLGWFAREKSGRIWIDALGKVATPLELSYLNDEAVRRLLEEPMHGRGFSYADGIVDEFAKVTAGYPILLQAMGQEIFKRVKDSFQSEAPGTGSFDLQIDEEVWMEVRSKFVRGAAENSFRRLWAADVDKIDRALCIAVAQGIGAASEEGWVDRRALLEDFQARSVIEERSLMDRLEFLSERGLLVRQIENGMARFRLMIPLMQEWLQINGDLDLELSQAEAARGTT